MKTHRRIQPMPHVRSRVNGLVVAVPPDAAGVIGRFASKGGNELIFDEQSLQKHPRVVEAPITVRSEAPDPGSPDARAASDANEIA